VTSVVYPDIQYYHDQKTEKTTLFDIQQLLPDDKTPIDLQKKPSFIINESASNQELGFDRSQIKEGVALDVAYAFGEIDGHSAAEIRVFQQRPDGDFDRVFFREIGRDGASAADKERAADQPNAEKPAASGEPATWSEYQRTRYTREEVETFVGAPLEAPAETPQQKQASLDHQYKDLSGPAIDRVAEKAADLSRQQEQNQQMNQQQDQHSHGFDL